MKSRLFFLLALVFLVLGLAFWCFRDTEPAVIPPSPLLSDAEDSTPTPMHSIPTPTPVPSAPLAERASPAPTLLPPDIKEQPREAVPSVVTAKGDASTNHVDPAILTRVQEERVPLVDIRSASLVVALGQYKQAIGSYPTGGCRAVSAALMGDNPKGVTFIEGHGWTNKQGELLDPWGTPYVFQFESDRLRVESLGPNKMLGDTDDVIRVKSF